MNNIINYLVTGKSLKKAYGKYMEGIGEQYGLSRMEIDVLLFLYNIPAMIQLLIWWSCAPLPSPTFPWRWNP